MRLPFLLWSALAACPGLCQFDIPVKEQYDHMAHKEMHGSYAGVIAYMVDNPAANPWSGYRYGEEVGYFLEGYLRMYETTKDKAYLIRFINLALKAMAWRNSDFFFTGESVGDDTVPYMNGVLLWPIAHFVHLILVGNDDLAGQVIPDGLIAYQGSTVPVNVLPYSSAHTYASIATWFMYRCVESLDAILAAHWNTESAFCHGDKICAVNMQAGFAGAMLYLGHLGNVNSTYSGLLSYLDKGAVVAATFSGDEPDDRCNCIEGDPVLIPFLSNSYWWHHKALSYKRRNCFYVCWGSAGFAVDEANLDGHHEFVEDISHGVIDLVIPTLSSRFALYTNDGYPFTVTDMVRFRNAFTQHIAQWNGTSWRFKNGVDGSNGPVSSCEGCSPHPAEHTFRYAALGWMPLQVYDGAPGAAPGASVYDVITHFYEEEVFGSPSVISGGLYHMGVAEVVSAQWEQECFNLTLFNRELVYDQDFAAKALLTVDAHGEPGASFADPVIHEPRFTVNGGVTSRFRAGVAVVWEPGFEAALGSVVEAEVDPMGCGMEYKSLQNMGWETTYVGREARMDAAALPEMVSAEQESNNSDLVPLFTLVPNPANHAVNVRLELHAAYRVSVEIRDALGRSRSYMEAGSLTEGVHDIVLDLHGYAPGMYACTVIMDQEPFTLKLMVE